MNYNQQVLQDLRRGEILTVIDGFNRYGCTNLRKPIHELRQAGHDIRCAMRKNKATGKRYGTYYLVAPGVRRVF